LKRGEGASIHDSDGEAGDEAVEEEVVEEGYGKAGDEAGGHKGAPVVARRCRLTLHGEPIPKEAFGPPAIGEGLPSRGAVEEFGKR
jgi:hypothetical protein